MKKNAGGLVVLLCQCSLILAQTNDLLVVPQSAENTHTPYGAGTLRDAWRYQQVYGSVEFPQQPILIHELRFRPDATYGQAFTTTVANIQFNLSTTTNSPNSLSSSFSQNAGTNDTIVFQGALTISSQFEGPAAGPKAFDIVVPLSQPFLYDPARGNLVVDSRNFSGSGAALTGGQGSFGTGPPDTAGRVLGTSVNASNGIVDSGADAIQIVYSTVTNQLTAVIPRSAIANDTTYGGGAFSEPNFRHQQVYGSNEFPGGAMLISELRFRPDRVHGYAFTTTVANIRIKLSTTQRAALSATYADNAGPDDTVVFQGSLPLSSQFLGPANGPKAFDMIVPLSQPFFYHPANGHLVVDIQNISGSSACRTSGQLGPDNAGRVLGTLGSPTGAVDVGADTIQIVYFPATAMPPVITSHPTNQTVFEGQSVSFWANVEGTAPLGYQWFKGTAAIADATNSTLILTNVQLSQAGDYSLAVSNAFGVATSQTATLTVNEVSDCVPVRNGLVSWWRAEGNAQDGSGMNHGAVRGATFALGVRGQAFSLDGDDRIAVPDSSSLAITPSLTIEGWLKIRDWPSQNSFGAAMVVFRGDDRSGFDAFYVAVLDSGLLRFAITATNEDFAAIDGPVVTNRFIHFAATIDDASGDMKLYLDGALAAQTNTTVRPIGDLGPFGSGVGIGNAHEGSGFRFGLNGLVDEVKLYARALTQAEVRILYTNAPCSESTSTLVVPNVSATLDDGGGSGILRDVIRSQIIYDASQFPAERIRITELRMRPSKTWGNAFTSTISNFQINLSTTSVEADQMNAVLAQNVGPDNMIGFQGALNVSSRFVGPVDGPKDFDIILPLSTPFEYDSRFGNLLVDFRNFSGSSAANVDLGQQVGDGSARVLADVNATSASAIDVAAEVLEIVYTTIETSLPPMITTQPTNQTVVDGGSAMFNVTAIGNAPLRYQWRREAIAIVNATNSTLILTNVQLSQAGNYTVLVSNAFGVATSQVATLTVNGLPPAIVSHPTNQSVMEGVSVTFSVSASGSAPLRYQWRRDASAITNATNSTLILTNVQLSQVGGYSVVVSNAFGEAISQTATLTVNEVSDCVPVRDGLVSWWRAEGNARDGSGSNHATLDGATFALGVRGQAFSFDGDDRVAVPDSGSVAITPSLTVEGWLKIQDWPSQNDFGAAMVVLRGDDRPGLDAFYVAVLDSGVLRFAITATNEDFAAIDAPVVTNRFVHFAATVDDASGDMKLYVDGALAAQTNTTVRPIGDLGPFGSGVGIGNAHAGSIFRFGLNGLVDELKLYSRALTQAEVRMLYTNAPCPSSRFDLSLDFSLAGNPNGAWSYGRQDTIGGTFTLLGTKKTNFANVPIILWAVSTFSQPAILHNDTTQSVVTAEGTYPPETTWFGPGPQGQPGNYAVARFTVPAGGDGTYELVTMARPSYIDSLQRDTDFHVVRKNVEIFGVQLNGTQTAAYTNTLGLVSGDTVDFAVGRGADNSYIFSQLKVQATLTRRFSNLQPRIAHLIGGSRMFTLTFNGLPGDYTIEASTNLIHWVTLTNIVAAAGQVHVADPQVQTLPQRFYRARITQ